MPFCTECGNNLASDAFCAMCGAPAAADQTTNQPPVAEPETSIHQPVAEQETSIHQPVDALETSIHQPVAAPETVLRADTPPQPGGYLPPPNPGAYAPPLQPAGYTPPQTYPAFAPAPQRPKSERWTAGKVVIALGFLVGIGAIGFLLTYFFNPLTEKNDTIPPPLPQLASSSSQTFAGAPDPKTDEGRAFDQLRRIAAQDRAALQSTQQWRAQIASSPATESAAQFLTRYQNTMRTMPNSLLAWSGDWPQSYGPSSRSSWVILSDFTVPNPQPVNSWCAQRHLGCWAKRISDFGNPEDNTVHPSANPGNN